MSLRLNFRTMRSFASKKKFIFFFGAPGVGKGTYAQRLAKDFKLNQISTGDEIRKILKEGTKSGYTQNLITELQTIVNAGKLVDDEIVLKIIKQKIEMPESKNGVLLDGFPRTESQLEKYEKIYPTNLVLNIVLDQSILLEKLMGRRCCVGCGRSYNICTIYRDGYEMDPLLPKKENTCDTCGDKLIIREDDTEAVIKKRMNEYDAKTSPLLEIYQKRV